MKIKKKWSPEPTQKKKTACPIGNSEGKFYLA